MLVPVKLPKHGLNMTTGLIAEIRVEVGDQVKEGDVLFEVETDKASLEVESEYEGTVESLAVEEGDELPVGATVLTLEVAAGADKEAVPAKSQKPDKPKARSGRVLASPAARKLAKEKGVDLAKLAQEGRVIEREDVEGYLRQQAAGQPAAEPPFTYSLEGRTKVERNTVKRLTSDRLSYSFREIPHFSLRRTVDLSASNAFLESARTEARDYSFNDLLLGAVAKALAEHPLANASYYRDELWLNPGVNVGYAVTTPRGLMVPVVRQADKLGLSGIAEKRGELVRKALDLKLAPEDLEEGSFTITNLGAFGVDGFTAVINPPQAAILSVGRFDTRVVIKDGQVSEVPIVQLTLSVDHRVLDGSEAANFLASVVSYLTEPQKL